MAYHQVDNLRKVGADGFAIVEKRYGRGGNNQIHERHAAPPARNCWPEYQHQKPAPNQYKIEPYASYDHNYQDPQEANYGYAAVKEPAALRSYHPAPAAKKDYETWYFLPMPQAPTKEGIEISSTEAAEHYNGVLFVEYDYNKTKPYHRGYN